MASGGNELSVMLMSQGSVVEDEIIMPIFVVVSIACISHIFIISLTTNEPILYSLKLVI